MNKTILLTESQLLTILRENLHAPVLDGEEPVDLGEISTTAKLSDGTSGEMPTTDKVAQMVGNSNRLYGGSFRGAPIQSYSVNESNKDFKNKNVYLGKNTVSKAKTSSGKMMKNIGTEDGMKMGTAYKRKHDLENKENLSDQERGVLQNIKGVIKREENISKNKKKLSKRLGSGNAFQKEGGEKNKYGIAPKQAHTPKQSYGF